MSALQLQEFLQTISGDVPADATVIPLHPDAEARVEMWPDANDRDPAFHCRIIGLTEACVQRHIDVYSGDVDSVQAAEFDNPHRVYSNGKQAWLSEGKVWFWEPRK